MKRILYGLLFLAVGLSLSLPADAEILIGEYKDIKLWTEIHTVGTFQALDQSNDDGSLEPDLSTGLQTAWGNMDWRAEFGDYAEMFFDVTMASRVRPDRWWGHQGYLLVTKFPDDSPLAPYMNPVLFDLIDLKAGHFEINFDSYHFRRSINADVQNNPLIGNWIVAPNGTHPHVEVIFNKWPIQWMLGTGIGDSTESFHPDRTYSFIGKIWGNPTLGFVPNMETSFSYYASDNSDVGGNTHSHLFSVERIGGRYGGVFADGNSPGDVLPGHGRDEAAWLLDLNWDITPSTNFFAQYGWVEDEDVDGPSSGNNSEQEWNYYGAELTQYLRDDLYLAGRWSVAAADKMTDSLSDGAATESFDSDGEVERIQLGGGFWITENILLKVEYVTEEMSGFKNGPATGTTDTVSGVDPTLNPEFDGFISELSMRL